MLKIISTLCLAILFNNCFAQTAIDVQHYRFEIELSDQSDTIKGKATIQVKFNEPADEFFLDLTSVDKKGKGMLAYSFSDGNNTLSGQQYPAKVEIKLAAAAKKDEIKTIVVEYKGIPTDGLIISKTKYGQRSFFADNWPNRGHNWIPCIDIPGDKASVEFIVTAPQHYQVVSNGILIEETNITPEKKLTHWKEDVPIATKVMVIGVADFAVGLAGMINNCIPVYSWVYPQDRDKGFYDYALAMEIMPFFIQTVGPYGYKKLANVESKTTFGGLENANTIFYSESSITGTRIEEDLLAHEIAHQWFGNMVTEKSFAHLWLSEGFADYFTIVYFEKKYGKEKADEMLQEARAQVIAFASKSNKAIVDEDPDYMKLLNANSYQKGSWVLHMLRQELGDSMFFKSIRNFYSAYAGKNADTKDLQQVCEKTSGKNLSIFFKQWLYTGGVPKLDLSWSYSSAEKKLSITVIQQQQTAFAFPLELKLVNANGEPVMKKINVSKQQETFSIAVKEKPVQVVLDPNMELLFSGNTMEKK